MQTHMYLPCVLCRYMCCCMHAVVVMYAKANYKRATARSSKVTMVKKHFNHRLAI